MITQKQRYGTVIVLALLLLLIAGAGAYQAIFFLLDAVSSYRLHDDVLIVLMTRMAVMVGVCFVAALIITLTSLIFMRREFERRRRTEERLGRVLKTAEQAGDLITILEKRGRIEYINKAVEETAGYTQKELVGKRSKPWLPWYTDEKYLRVMRETVMLGTPYRAEVICRRKSGEPFVLQEHVTPLKDSRGNITRMLSTAREVTRQKDLEEKLDHLAHHDALTGIPNRRRLVARLEQELAAARQGNLALSVLIMDIDRFKYINDIFGYEMGDKVLTRTAELLRAAIGNKDLVARLGSDEFAVVHLSDTLDVDAAAVARKIKDAIASSMRIGEQDIVVTVTIGIAVFPQNGEDAETLLKNADMALSRAKVQGRNTVQFFSSDIVERMSDFYFLEKRLFSALKNDEYLIDYQPYCDLSTRKIAGVEALIKWNSGDRGMVSPSKFIPTLEDTGLIIDVGEWVMRTACKQIKAWNRNGTSFPVSVNLSLLQFRHKYLVDMVSDAIREFRLDPRCLTLEVTEGICIHDMDLTISILRKLKDTGISISVDDFGTGYSSLNYIKKLPVDNLKIDMSFVRDVAKDPDAASIITAITGLARSLNLKTIAEGVETEEQRNILHLLRCDMGQGYYFSPAVSAAEFEKLIF
jgi:diguanylate cyclase (GGDEF)-like protein/PAS domain S-box-containing protein